MVSIKFVRTIQLGGGNNMKKLLFVLLAVIALFPGCDFLEDDNITEEKLESIFEYEFNENVKFYDNELSVHVSLINDTTLLVGTSMPSEHVPQVGDVILCPSTTNTPRGFLRRVESIDSSTTGLTVNTSPATLADAFKTLRFEQTFNYAECVKEFRDSLGNPIPFEVLAGSVMEQLDTLKANTPTKARGEADLGAKSLKFDISNRSFSGSAYIESQIYVKFDIGFGKVEVSYEIDKKVGLKGKAFISSSELVGTDYEDDFSLPIMDKNIPIGTAIGPPLMQFFPSLNFGIALVGNGNLSLEGEVNYVIEDTKSRYTYKNGVEHNEVINNLDSNSSWMKMVALEVEGEFGIQGSVGMEFRLWNGDLLAFGGEAALWYGLTAEAGISMSDKALLVSNPTLTVGPKLSAALYIESFLLNNRNHRIEAKVERSFENFEINILPKFEYTKDKKGNKLAVSPTIEPISMIEVSQQGFALFSDKNPDTPIVHQALPSSTIIEEVPTKPYVDTQLDPEEVEFIIPTDSDEPYFVRPYVIADEKYYYGEGGIWIDLGLPSGILWAEYNVGTCSPEEYGGYYAWGETEVKSSYTTVNYKYTILLGYDEWGIPIYEYKYLGDDISGTQYDAAHVQWGDGVRMPTHVDMDDLLTKCIWTLGTYNNVTGSYVIGPNGNKIFLPFAGWYDAYGLTGIGVNGSFWTGSTSVDLMGDISAWAFGCLLHDGNLAYDGGAINRYHGRSIRPVKDKETED